MATNAFFRGKIRREATTRPQQGHKRVFLRPHQATTGHKRVFLRPRQATTGHKRVVFRPRQATTGHNRPQTCRNKARPCGFEATSGQLAWFRDCFLGLDFQQVLGDQVVPVLYTCLPVYTTPNLGSKNLSNSGFACVGLPCKLNIILDCAASKATNTKHDHVYRSPSTNKQRQVL